MPLLGFCRLAYTLDGTIDEWLQRWSDAASSAMDQGHGSFAAVIGVDGRLAGGAVSGASRLNLLACDMTCRLAPNAVQNALAIGTGFASEVAHFPALEPILRRLGLPADNFVTCAADEIGSLALTCVLVPRTRVVSSDTRRLLPKLGPHQAAGLRLRRAVAGLSNHDPVVEARFEPDGRCTHATGAATSRDARAQLQDFVRRRERSRNRAERGDVEEGDAWLDSVVAGRWTVVDSAEDERERYFVAYRNPAEVVDVRRLSDRECAVVLLAAQGLRNTDIAEELEISRSTVGSTLSNALQKLGLQSAVSLPNFFSTPGEPALASHELLRIVRITIPDAPELTDAEQSVLRLMVAGFSDREIARRRGTAHRTVRNQITTALEKLGVSTRREAAALLDTRHR